LVEAILTLLAIIYTLTAVALTIFVSSFGVLLAIYFFTRHKRPTLPVINETELPSVTIQLPIYNEAHVVDRLIEACAYQDYPQDKFHIQILDDSTDETVEVVAQKIAEMKAQGFSNISHIRRSDRKGYKAGALAYGLELITTEFIAIFDADFVPTRDFLRRTMPHFVNNEKLALVQTRWDHLNLDYNWLTRVQALNIDAHFAIEQVARNRGRLPMSMNGTGGLWRVAAIYDAGGWSSSTLTEDLDLSYRALMKGWDFLYLVDVPVPGELPPQVQAYKMQQARWATGSTECLIKHAIPLLRSSQFSTPKKFMGLMHLSQYLVQPFILLLFLLTPPLLWGDMFTKIPDLRIIGVFSIIPPLLIIWSQAELYRDWRRRLLFFPVQFVVGAAVVLSNTRAVLAAFHKPGIEREFKRTPKFRLTKQGEEWGSSHYALEIDAITIGEFALALYALFGFYLALQNLPALAPYMLAYTISFTIFAYWNIYQSTARLARRS
jgi:cellulose synthase/poly-beta-1,6-N-acetylglucosamine synthase-like glycosyltransferase